jgi:hypothetical protein
MWDRDVVGLSMGQRRRERGQGHHRHCHHCFVLALGFGDLSVLETIRKDVNDGIPYSKGLTLPMTA